MPEFFDDRRPHDGFSYEEYREYWTTQREQPLDDADAEDRRMHHYLNYNWDRQATVHDAYVPSDELRRAVNAIEEPQLWMVLTEAWCGDSAFLLPVIAEAASLSDDVTLRILLRDDNLDVMDEYLTDGSRSIPKLVAFSEGGDELFTWGPRPAEAAQRFAELREQYDDKKKAIADLLEYYKEGGWRGADTELAEMLQVSVPVV